MKSCKLLFDDDMRPAAQSVCQAMECELTVVDTAPVWQKQARRGFQVDMPDFHYRILEEVGALTGSSPESLLRGWVEEVAQGPAGGAAEKTLERCRMIARWQGMGFTGRETDLRHFALRLMKA